MAKTKNLIKKEIEKIWPEAKKNIAEANKDIIRLMKGSEKKLVNIYENVKRNAERLISKAKREELYYELGKNVAPLLTSDQLKNKNILKTYSEIQMLNKKLRLKK